MWERMKGTSSEPNEPLCTGPQEAQTPVPLSWKMKEIVNDLCYVLFQDTAKWLELKQDPAEVE